MLQARRFLQPREALSALLALAGFLGLTHPVLSATGTIQDVQHVVVLMMENRSFDEYFGTAGGVRGFNDRNALLLNNGQPDLYQYQGTNYVLPFPATNQFVNDVDHSENSGIVDWDFGKWDMWLPAKGASAMSYYPPSFLPLQSALISNYTICDNYFCSLIGPTYPNRLYLFTGMVDPEGTGGGPAVANYIPTNGFSWTTYPELLQNAGVTWRVYRPNGDWFGDPLPWFAQYMNLAPGNPLYDRGVAEVPNVVTALHGDVISNTLPRVSWIIPTFEQSGHPPYSAATSELFISNIMAALSANPAVLNSTVFLVTYDEAGGFYDHVPAPIAPPNTPDEYVGGEPLGLGVRVPMFAISPWSRGGRVCSQVFDHTSVIRFLEQWTGVVETNISGWRRQTCGDLTSAFDFAHPNTNNYALLPSIPPATGPTYTPVPPAVQTLPAQQTNLLYSMPLPYQMDISAQTDCTADQLYLNFTNSGAASVHLAIYARPVQNKGPLQYDIAPGNMMTELLPASGNYDYTCMGPNGFQRRFAGNMNLDCGKVEAGSTIDTNGGTITITLQNTAAHAVTFLLTDGYGIAGPWTNVVAAGTSATVMVPAISNNFGWYDLTANVSVDGTFLRHFTGHIENGAISMSQPLTVISAASAPSSSSSSSAAGTTTVISAASTPAVQGLIAGLPAIPAGISTGNLPCYATRSSTNLVLIFPSWAAAGTILASPSLTSPTWTPVSATMDTVGNYAVATLPMSPKSLFFQIRR